jgi:putative thioredoxin
MNATHMNAAPNVIEVNAKEFQTDVVEKSRLMPVVLEFYAPGAEPSEQLAPIMSKLAEEFKGKFRLGRVNVQDNQQIVQQLNVRTLPTLKIIVNAQIAHELEGPQEESKLRELLETLTMSPIERIREQITLLLANGDRQGAIQMLQEAIAQEPQNYVLHVELADLLIMETRINEAREILASVPTDTAGIAKPKNRIEFIEMSATMPAIKDLQATLAKTPSDLPSLYQLAVSLVADDQIEEALETLLLMLKTDKAYEDALARKTMVKVFDLLGKGDPVATAYRRKMFTFLH